MAQLTGRSCLTPLASDILRATSVKCDAPEPLRTLAENLGVGKLELVVLFVSPDTDVEKLVAGIPGAFPSTTVIGCTTAGEISGIGYTEGEIVAIGLPHSHFRASATLIGNINRYDSQAMVDQLVQDRNELANKVPDWANEFNFLLIDGMSGQEDGFAVALSAGWGPAPLFGGSAGDGLRFKTTFIIFNDCVFARDAAIITHIRTRCPVRVFKTDHVSPTEQRMVVTHANPARRLVHEINAEPAAREYARLVGIDPKDLSPAVLGTNPVVVRIAGQHYVRGIRNVTDDGSLLFTAAIDEGIVLTLAQTTDIATHLRREMRELTRDEPLVGVIACDCLYRRTDAEENEVIDEVSEILSGHRVFGFSSYGELFNSMHINQTLTGVAIYAPPAGA